MAATHRTQWRKVRETVTVGGTLQHHGGDADDVAGDLARWSLPLLLLSSLFHSEALLTVQRHSSLGDDDSCDCCCCYGLCYDCDEDDSRTNDFPAVGDETS